MSFCVRVYSVVCTVYEYVCMVNCFFLKSHYDGARSSSEHNNNSSGERNNNKKIIIINWELTQNAVASDWHNKYVNIQRNCMEIMVVNHCRLPSTGHQIHTLFFLPFVRFFFFCEVFVRVRCACCHPAESVSASQRRLLHLIDSRERRKKNEQFMLTHQMSHRWHMKRIL